MSTRRRATRCITPSCDCHWPATASSRERNKAVKSALKTSQKKVQTAISGGDADAAVARQREAARALDKAASKGVLHKRTAARKKSRLAKQVNATSAA